MFTFGPASKGSSALDVVYVPLTADFEDVVPPACEISNGGSGSPTLIFAANGLTAANGNLDYVRKIYSKSEKTLASIYLSVGKTIQYTLSFTANTSSGPSDANAAPVFTAIGTGNWRAGFNVEWIASVLTLILTHREASGATTFTASGEVTIGVTYILEIETSTNITQWKVNGSVVKVVSADTGNATGLLLQFGGVGSTVFSSATYKDLRMRALE